jgi:carotenoid cleavage dioxygenase-like enzyme
MAHLEALTPEISLYPYKEGKLVGSQVKFPATAAFSSMNKPTRFEGDLFNLEVTGKIPPEINGTFYRVQPVRVL